MKEITRETHPGIIYMLSKYHLTGKTLSAHAEELLRGMSPLSPALREFLAAFTSGLNSCKFCCLSHLAAACNLAGLSIEKFKELSHSNWFQPYNMENPELIDPLEGNLKKRIPRLVKVISESTSYPEKLVEGLLWLCVISTIQFEGPYRKPAMEEFIKNDFPEIGEDERNSAILVAASFGMFNRYVELMQTYNNLLPEEYYAMGKMLAENGYVKAGAEVAAQ